MRRHKRLAGALVAFVGASPFIFVNGALADNHEECLAEARARAHLGRGAPQQVHVCVNANLPDTPGTPGVPGVPEVPGAPELPGVPAPELPGVPGVPGAPELPGVPAPELPGVPGVPGAPELPGTLPTPPLPL